MEIHKFVEEVDNLEFNKFVEDTMEMYKFVEEEEQVTELAERIKGSGVDDS